MGFFDVFKRSRKEINRSNQEQGKAGEEQVKAKYELNGYKVTRTGKGHDYRATKKNWWTGKRETKYVEVKTGNAKLSPLQRKKKKQYGSKYVEERVDANPLTGYGGNSFFGSGSSEKRKKTSKSSEKSIFDSVFGSSKPKKRKSSSSDSIWGSSKPKKRKSSSSDSIWGSSSSSDSFFGSGSSKKRSKKKSNTDNFW